MDSFRIEDAKYAHGVKYVYAVKKMCQWLDVSSSAFFDWRRRPQSATAARRERLKLLIAHEFAASDGTYGYRRIHAVLQRSHVPCSAELVRALMRELGLQPCQPRPWRHSLTTADDQAPALPDLVGRDFTADAPGRRLVGDITYIPTWEGWLYLATVIDCHTKMVLGYAMGDNYKTPLISAALQRAAERFPLEPDAIFHSDRGSNYTSREFAVTLTELGLRQSVGRTGICYEVSRRRESHPPPLSEPCVTVSRYTAPIAEPVGMAPCFQWANSPG
jgi:putative transposase